MLVWLQGDEHRSRGADSEQGRRVWAAQCCRQQVGKESGNGGAGLLPEANPSTEPPAGESAGVRVYDSFAHHPDEVSADLAAARSLVRPDGRVVTVFQPVRPVAARRLRCRLREGADRMRRGGPHGQHQRRHPCDAGDPGYQAQQRGWQRPTAGAGPDRSRGVCGPDRPAR
ncbi:glutamate ligase domain-containing protein [Streptomyces asoensis]|uniref:glutamate ligase domain-containing protein n=1 Tax=Streptomyces asoensis TaxID=249586 RepID=UPI003F5423E6